MGLTRRQLTGLLIGGAAASLLAACGTSASSTSTTGSAAGTGASAAPGQTGTGGAAQAQAQPTQANPLVKPRATGAELTAVMASSEIAQGRNRVALGLIDARNQAIASGNVLVEYFKLGANNTAEKRAESPAVFRTVGGESKGIWVTPGTFTETGPWGAQVSLDQATGDQPKVARLSFDVRPKFSAPGYGEPAVRSKSLTERDVNGDLSRICSNTPPCALHTQSIADALAPGQKPLVVVFATPALCTSATCAPELEAVQQLHQTYGEQANFIHVEIYQYPFDQLKTAAAVDEWHLPSDPWAFIVDKAGVVQDRFEGAAPFEELEPSLKAVLS
jgi:hypothetical protein